MAAILASAILVTGAIVASCQFVAGVDGAFNLAPVDAGIDVVSDAAQDSGDAGSDTGAPGCVSATYPDPPAGVDDGKDIGPIVVALHSVDLGDMGTIPGYDLDHVCTCTDDAGPTCVGRSMQPGLYCDVPGDGIDNQFAKVVQLIEIPLGGSISSQTFSDKANAGLWSMLIEVHGYNGDKDDAAVTVAIYPAPALGTTPKWDGTDSWPILQSSVDGMGAPVYVSMGAYVSGQTLVATVPSVPITFAGNKQTLTLTLSGAVLTGKLVQSNGAWRLIQSVLAARLALTDFFKALSSYRDNQGKPLCTNSGFVYSTAKTSVCGDADITVDGTLPKSAPCDALSFGMGFTADPALRGPAVPAPVPTPGCAPGTDPATDMCP